MQQLTIVKIGGNIIDDEARLTSFLKDFVSVRGHKILVHGGGKVATEIGIRLGIEPQYVNGRRITDAATLEVVTMVYGGLINKRITAQLQSLGCNAIGLTGADANIMPAVKRPVKDVDYGYVGDISSDHVNGVMLKTFLEAGLVPVLAPLTYDADGTMLNTNADTIAQEVAKRLAGITTVQLIYCFEKKGVLADAGDDTSVINGITTADFEMLKADGIISDGMIPKLENAFAAIDAGVIKVSIGHAADLHDIISGAAGTSIL
jgi:acetylglutamate kinase